MNDNLINLFPEGQEHQPLTHILPLIRNYMAEAKEITYVRPPCMFLGEWVERISIKGGTATVVTEGARVRLPITTGLVKYIGEDND